MARYKMLCKMHHARLRETGRIGPAHRLINRRGEGCIRDGYRLITVAGHPHANKNGQVREHLVVMCNILGRKLFPEETVHHKNGIRSDNRPENLELWSSRHPKGQRVADLIAHAKEILALYEPGSLKENSCQPKSATI